MPDDPATALDDADDTTDQPSPAPAGKLRQDTARVLDAIILARLSGSVKDLLLLIYRRTYTMPKDDPHWGWVKVNQQELATLFHTTKSDINARLKELRARDIIQGDRPSYSRFASLRDPNDWQPETFSWGDAQKKHTRAGAGAPPYVREREPAHVPLEERDGDQRGRNWLEQIDVRSHCLERGLQDESADIHWRVVDYFQRTFDQHFKGEWLDELTRQLQHHTSTAMIAKLTEAANDKRVKAPWGWLLTCLENAPKPTPQEDKPNVRRNSRVRAQGDAGVSSVATGDTNARARFILNADDAEYEDEPDDTDRGDVRHADATTTR